MPGKRLMTALLSGCRGATGQGFRKPQLVMIIAVILAVVVLPIAAIGLNETWQNRRHRALASRRKDKHLL